MIYRIAELNVEMTPQFPRLTRQCGPYLASGTPDFSVMPDPADQADANMARRTPEEQEYICCSAVFCRSILRHGRFFLHASAVVSEGEAYLFSAPSGTGKSTLTAHWCRQFPGSFILNDDKPVLWPGDSGITAWGSPFSGKSDLQVNRTAPVRGICFLKQDRENRIRTLGQTESLALMLNNTWRPKDSQRMDRLLDMIERVVTEIPVYELRCTGEPEAARLAHEVMKGM